MSLILAIDQSTSSTKAILFDAQGGLVDAVAKEHAQHYPQPGWVEHDAEEIWQNLLQACRELCLNQSARLAEIAGVAITNQRETFVVFDRATGQPLAPAIVWQCRRGDEVCEQLRAAGHDQQVAAKTGLKIDSYFSGAKITWLMRNRPELAKLVHAGKACVSTIEAYLIYRLTDGRVFASDPTNASRTLLYDIHQRGWDESLCQLFEIPVQALPEVRENASRFGLTDLGGALPAALPICGVMGDSQASLFAQRCFTPGDAKATFGTGTSVLLNIGSQVKLPEQGAVAALAWVVDGKPTYAWEGLINYSAATIAWLKDQLGMIASAAEAEQLASQVENCEGVYLVPAFAGLGAPHWRAEARAAIVGMTAFTRREHIVRAALESIAFQVNDVVEMLADSGVRPQHLAADGGATSNRLLMQIVADLAQVEIQASATSNSSALGAAMAGMVGLGLVDGLEGLSRLPRESHAFVPTMPADQVAQSRLGWQQAVGRVL